VYAWGRENGFQQAVCSVLWSVIWTSDSRKDVQAWGIVVNMWRKVNEVGM
jgi:hypothetical protein